MASNMPKDVEARIRALPGNNVCCDCSNVNPQWASVSYGSLMCLECSGLHRSLGVHLSFVRSIAMDSWTDRQVAAMEKSGGNTKLVEYLRSRGIEKSMPIAKKYNTPQAAYIRERLTRWLDGKTEPPPDPGRYDPQTGGGDAQGAEPLPGETPDQYNARQARLREAARERMRQKFGQSGLGGVGGQQDMGGGGFEFGGLGGAVSGVGNFLKSNVLENEAIRGTLGGVINSVSNTVNEGDLVEKLKRNATMQEGSAVQRGVGWLGNALGGGQGNTNNRNGQGPPPGEDDDDFFASLGQGKRAGGSGGYGGGNNGNGGSPGGGYPSPSSANRSSGKDFRSDDDWGEWADTNQAPPPVPTKEDLAQLSKDLGMKLSTGTGGPMNSAPAPTPQPAAAQPAIPRERSTSGGVVGAATPQKKAPVKKESTEDFFSAFGV